MHSAWALEGGEVFITPIAGWRAIPADGMIGMDDDDDDDDDEEAEEEEENEGYGWGRRG